MNDLTKNIIGGTAIGMAIVLVFVGVVALAQIGKPKTTDEIITTEITTIDSVGLVVDADVISTSFNSCTLTQIKTDKMFLVVFGLPQLSIGKQLKVIKQDSVILKIIDNTGKSYLVSRKSK